MPPSTRPFGSLYFGEAAAEDEAEKNPSYFVEGYYDVGDARRRIDGGDAFLLIGPKGAGKTSYIEYLKLTSDGHNAFIRTQDLGDLRGGLKDDATLAESGAELSELAWSTWLWCQLFDLVVGDPANTLSREPEAVALQAELRSLGVLGNDFRAVLQEVRKKSHKFSAPKFYEYRTETTGSRRLNLGQLRDLLAELVVNSSGPNRHIVTLDGLDSAVIGNESYWKHLAALLRSATVVHRRIRKAEGVHLRIVMLCRSDIFLKIPLPDSNKIRQSWGIEIDWAYGLETAKDSHLWDLIESKASKGKKTITHVVDLYFPKRMRVGDRTDSRSFPMHEYLMQLTRGTPRDMIMLLRKIQEQSRGLTELTLSSIRAGVNAYCRQYFVGEMANELVGLIPAGLSEGIISSLSRVQHRYFTREKFEEVFGNSQKKDDDYVTADDLLRQLFLAGAIANVVPGREEYVHFYHRRSHAEVNLAGPFLVHTALALALNLKFTRPE